MKTHHIRRHHVVIAVAATIIAVGGYAAKHQATPAPVVQPSPVVTPMPAVTDTSCDPSLWTFVYHPDRLPSKTDCRSVTGIVAWDKIEPDGDYHIRLQLDDPNSAPVNSANIGGYLVVEPICQQTPTQSDAIGPCSGYNGPHFPLPAVGSHVRVSGYYTIDAQHNWMEMHTVSHLDTIQ